jgi:CspA family cold shock protein
MPTGIVKFVHDKDGYGFIDTDAIEDDDVFFHQSFIEEGDEVEFGIEEGDRGPRATDLRRP